jgi:hypothetical protein
VRHSRVVLAFLACGSLLFACQGDQNIPSEPDRGLDLTAAGVCKDTTFTAASAIYTNFTVQNSKLKACKTILGFVQRNQIGKAEVEIDKLLVAIYNDYQNDAAALAAVSPNTLEQSVANYIGAACGLAPLSASECPVPNDLDDPADGIDADDLDGWIAAGPLTGSATSLGTGILQNALFAFGVEGGPAYVIVSERRRTGVDGPCPGEFAYDCQDDVFDVDVDDLNQGATFVTVESCAEFGKQHAHCPEGQGCAFGVTANPLNLVPDAACTAAAYHDMGFWGKFAFQTTRPVHWVVHATPAYAGTTTKFGAYSPIVLADDVPRTRGADCRILDSQFYAGSEGSTCRLLSGGAQLAACLTLQDGTNSSSCTLTPAIPEDITVMVTAEKTSGNGVYNASSAPFGMGPANPARGDPNLQVCFELTNSTVGQVNCP